MSSTKLTHSSPTALPPAYPAVHSPHSLVFRCTARHASVYQCYHLQGIIYPTMVCTVTVVPCGAVLALHITLCTVIIPPPPPPPPSTEY
ncbi:hypothetical protein K504DRAFT_180028 [Pleomassaria siparia CBS 279.74]|uniref:Uncharacterized protein n=1 Tax=Pleomassaria siparia CBS 279.74 TaxID=1314801 RepID=A0A6G1JSI8_9PLEO|nr:hypothetical protein K504DRAFT_180028 [Pleomassaria siparia CBS 279.74]